MYSIKWTYGRVHAHLEEISQPQITAGEAYVLTVFLIEKIIRRTLVQLVIWKGNTAAKAFKTVKGLKGIGAVKKEWEKYDPKNRSLENVIDESNWNVIKAAAIYRNDLVHGYEHQAQKVYSRHRRKLLATLDDIKDKFAAEYDYYGWRKMRDSAGNPV